MTAVGMIDLHCHVLAGLDDGPADMGDAVVMLADAERNGIEVVCATPHIRHDHDVTIADLAGRVEELNNCIPRPSSVSVRTGGEVAETIVDQLTDDELLLVTLGGGGRWILLEPAPGPIGDSLEHTVCALRERGFRSVIAHPERHLCADLVPRLSRLIRRGALVQATAAAFVHGPAVPGMSALARAGVIHLLGSDAHTSRAGRTIALAAAYDVLASIEPVGRHLSWIMSTAPRAVIDGDDTEPPYAAVS